jgi:hypothetical protein
MDGWAVLACRDISREAPWSAGRTRTAFPLAKPTRGIIGFFDFKKSMPMREIPIVLPSAHLAALTWFGLLTPEEKPGAVRIDNLKLDAGLP